MMRMIVSALFLCILVITQVHAGRLIPEGFVGNKRSSDSRTKIRTFYLEDESNMQIIDYQDGSREMSWSGESIVMQREDSRWRQVMDHVKRDSVLTFELLLDLFDQVDTEEFFPSSINMTAPDEDRKKVNSSEMQNKGWPETGAMGQLNVTSHCNRF